VSTTWQAKPARSNNRLSRLHVWKLPVFSVIDATKPIDGVCIMIHSMDINTSSLRSSSNCQRRCCTELGAAFHCILCFGTSVVADGAAFLTTLELLGAPNPSQQLLPRFLSTWLGSLSFLSIPSGSQEDQHICLMFNFSAATNYLSNEHGPASYLESN
jgi:hypothetical protein